MALGTVAQALGVRNRDKEPFLALIVVIVYKIAYSYNSYLAVLLDNYRFRSIDASTPAAGVEPSWGDAGNVLE